MMTPRSSSGARTRMEVLFGFGVLVAIVGAAVVIGGTSATDGSPAPAVKPATTPTGHVHVHKYTPKNNPQGGSGWKHEGGHDWSYLVDGTNDYSTRNNDSTEVDQDDYEITETLTGQQADGWQLLDIYVPDHGKGTPGGGNDQCERDGPRPEGQRLTAAQVPASYFTDQDHNNNGTVHVCAFNGQAPSTRTVRVQKVTSATSHPGGTFTVGVGLQSAQLTLNPNSGSSAVELITGAPVNQSLPVSETLPASPAGWSLTGFIVKADPGGSATCSASEIGWEQSPSVPPDASPYLVCVKDWYSAVTGTGSISGEKYHDLDADGARDPGEPGLEGWLITAVRMNGARIDPFVTTTSSNGSFAFQGLPEGTYSVCETLQPGWTATQPSGSCYTSIVTPGGELSGLAFGNMRPGSLTVVKVDLGLNGSWTFDASGPTHPAPQTMASIP